MREEFTFPADAAELKRQNEYLLALHEVSLGLLNRLSLDDLLENILLKACNLFGTTDSYISIFHKETCILERKMGTGRYALTIGEHHSWQQGLINQVFKTHQAQVIEEYQKWAERKPGLLWDDLQTAVCIPLIIGSEIIGVIGIEYFDQPRCISANDLNLCHYFAELAAISIDNARLYEGMQRELKERKKIQEALTVSEEKYHKAFRYVDDVIGIASLSNGKIIEINDTFFRTFMYDQQDIIGKTSLELGLWANPVEYYHIYQMLHANGTVRNYPVTWQTKHGEIRYGLDSAEVIEINNESCIVYIWHDITEQKKAADELVRLNNDLERKVEERTQDLYAANEELSALNETLQQQQQQLIRSEKMAALWGLVSGVAHEINTPLGNCITTLTFMQQCLQEYMAGGINREEQELFRQDLTEAMVLLDSNLRKTARLINSFKNIGIKEYSGDSVMFSVKNCIEETLMELKALLKKRQIQIQVQVDDTLLWYGNPHDLTRIITNFVMNSLTHAFKEEEHGAIVIVAERQDNKLAIEYTDDGKGIDEAVVDKIFDPFFTTRRAAGAIGLGLYIVYTIVTQKLNGRIYCESTVGAGTRFMVSIPLLSE